MAGLTVVKEWVMRVIDRRSFFRRAFGVGVLAMVTKGAGIVRAKSGESPAGRKQAIRLGGPIFNAPEDPEELAIAHRRVGYRAAYCPDVELAQGDKIRAISSAFEKHNVVIAEVGRWVNLLDSNAERRRANLQLVTDGLALADEIGALCCVDIAGSFNPTTWFGPHPENLSQRFFDAAVENARKIIDAVKPKRAKFCYEMMGWAIPDSPESALRLVRAVDRKAFGVHLDPCNLINCPSRFYDNTALLNECFDKLGPWIVSCHAKDLAWEIEMNIHFKEVRPGTGSLDYRTYLRRLAQLPGSPPLMLEHLPNEQEYDAARTYLLSLAREIGIECG
ncbi:MAG: sugar phosphate isomerase/epimerase [Verrucomicrobiae bacterium]|nr:sugar phosphate isomerase/epimerase [Verrucomicrobiae bacterium]